MRKREDSRYLCAVNIRSQANLTRLTRLELYFLSVHSYVTSNFTCLVAAMIILLGGLVVSHKCLRFFAFCIFSVAKYAHILSLLPCQTFPCVQKQSLVLMLLALFAVRPITCSCLVSLLYTMYLFMAYEESGVHHGKSSEDTNVPLSSSWSLLAIVLLCIPYTL
jgi:hypothetical protein